MELGVLIPTFFDFERCLMFYVGLDIHTKRIAFCVLSEKGQFVQRGQVRGLQEVLRILQDLPDRFEVCYEAVVAMAISTTCYSRWPYGSWWRIRGNCG